ncbi:hypothetical protein [Streptomyces sp. NBC_01429]|uniref:hypothetical protein n=1 Tax=Streptomyces sp. NBC_01429 TaxID=2903862 RepID=UPI002E2A9EE0|nr:hypothetical protein [Streptomyces sp. NBC_01429]
MRTFGMTYDTGFTTAGTTTREPFDPAVVRREMRIIRDELHCDAVRVTGGDRDFDKASFGVVKVLDGGRTGTA